MAVAAAATASQNASLASYPAVAMLQHMFAISCGLNAWATSCGGEIRATSARRSAASTAARPHLPPSFSAAWPRSWPAFKRSEAAPMSVPMRLEKAHAMFAISCEEKVAICDVAHFASAANNKASSMPAVAKAHAMFASSCVLNSCGRRVASVAMARRQPSDASKRPSPARARSLAEPQAALAKLRASQYSAPVSKMAASARVKRFATPAASEVPVYPVRGCRLASQLIAVAKLTSEKSAPRVA
mmetsp:Transcript_17024/g.57537  ORF Transcript_17024/g.57537 Transcript_17024/m.57537 type:complete len:244 (+) Transcript_17024:542-1273(+)